jgi:hypothetical protein
MAAGRQTELITEEELTRRGSGRRPSGYVLCIMYVQYVCTCTPVCVNPVSPGDVTDGGFRAGAMEEAARRSLARVCGSVMDAFAGP